MKAKAVLAWVALSFAAQLGGVASAGGPTGVRVLDPRTVAERFYAAFSALRSADLAPFYAPDVKFRDAIFQYEDRAGTMRMWKQILGAQPAPRIRYAVTSVSGETVTGRWIADYVLFGHPVHNEVVSTLTVRNGQIVRHVDAFPFGRWAAQAFGLRGTRLEWLASDPHFQTAVVGAFRLAVAVRGIELPRLPNLCQILTKASWLAKLVQPVCAGR